MSKLETFIGSTVGLFIGVEMFESYMFGTAAALQDVPLNIITSVLAGFAVSRLIKD